MSVDNGVVTEKIRKPPTIGTITSSSKQILPADPTRRYLLIHNPNSVNIGLTFDGTAVIGAEGTATLFPGGTLVFESNTGSTNAWSAVADSGSQSITVWIG